MYQLTIFKNQFDNKTHRTVSVDTWEEFDDLLYGLSKQKGEKGGRNSSPLITPAVLRKVLHVAINLFLVGAIGVLLMLMTMSFLITL